LISFLTERRKNMRLEDKVAIVTGGGRGIGKTIALTLMREGAKVVIVGRTKSDLDKVVEKAGAAGGQMKAMRVDVSNETEIEEMVGETVKRFGRIDILVNNAGAVIMSPAEKMSTEQWDAVVDVNLKAPFLCSRAVGKEMIKRRSGKIINISSRGGHSVIPLSASYGASKAGLQMLTKALAVEWGKYNINVNSVSPGVTETGMFAKFRADRPEEAKAREDKIPLKRVNQPEDVANAVLFLASSDADKITGEDIGVDGGMLSVHPGYVHML
jgi:NAD(P)-dependent dehydrogenase (short-subunit alcohol dehydrogenase family)